MDNPIGKNEPLKIEDFDDNPWSVDNVSAFLKYCCPECGFSNQTLKIFTDHAVENHTKARRLFTPENIFKQIKLDIKSEDPEEGDQDESFDYENFDFDVNYNPNDFPDTDLHENVKTELIEFDNNEDIDNGEVYDNQDSIQREEEIDPSIDGISCRYCENISYSIGDLIQHHSKEHKDKPPSIYKCHTCNFFSKINKNVQDHSLKEHGKKYFAYQCPKCDKQMKSFLSYRSHVRSKCKVVEIKGGKKSCDVCVIEFSSKPELKSHISDKHMDGKLYTCAHCDHKPKQWQSLQRHLDHTHPESGQKKYFCDQCDAAYIFEPTLYYHKWRLHNGDKRHVCNICGKQYNYKAGYREHMLTQHNQGEATSLVCEMCGYSTISKDKLYRHIKRKHEAEKWSHKCQYCPFQSHCIQKFETHIDAKHPEHGEKKFFCDHCPKSFIFERALKKHVSDVKIQTMKKQQKAITILACDYCDKVLKSYYLAKIHYKNHHPDQPIIASGHANFSCSVCVHRFFLEEDLESHLTLEHGIDTMKDYCTKCGKSIKENEDHTCPKRGYGIKKEPIQYKCHICQKVFSEKHILKRHTAAIHEGKTYPCSQCNRTFTASYSLKNHVLTVHDKRLDFECNQCGKKWATKGLLRDHITQAHTSQVLCDICNKQISNPIMLRRHKVFVHNERKGAIFCEMCPKSVFFSKSTFDQHVRAKH